MNLANKLTFFRIILAPVFLLIYFLLKPITIWAMPVLVMIYVISEITDYFDGWAARKLNLTSDFGKLFDPFADTLVQSTYFLCFLIDGIWGSTVFPVILFLLFLYREFSILFLRNMMLKKGIILGARMSGKVKTVGYIVAGSVALFVACFERLVPAYAYKIAALAASYETILPILKLIALIIFFISVIIAIVSFIDYLLNYQKTEKEKSLS